MDFTLHINQKFQWMYLLYILMLSLCSLYHITVFIFSRKVEEFSKQELYIIDKLARKFNIL